MQQKLTQHCKSTILQKKLKKKEKKKIDICSGHVRTLVRRALCGGQIRAYSGDKLHLQDLASQQGRCLSLWPQAPRG